MIGDYRGLEIGHRADLLGAHMFGSSQPEPTVKSLLIAGTPPWNRIAPMVIDAILEAITDKGFLEAFVMVSMNHGLVARYEALGWENSDSIVVIRAQISQILCETGNRAMPALAKSPFQDLIRDYRAFAA
jgi:hypothetical protein